MSDDMIRTYMAAAGMLVEDLSVRLVLEPLDPDLTGQMRVASSDLIKIAEIVDAIRRVSPSGSS